MIVFKWKSLKITNNRLEFHALRNDKMISVKMPNFVIAKGIKFEETSVILPFLNTRNSSPIIRN